MQDRIAGQTKQNAEKNGSTKQTASGAGRSEYVKNSKSEKREVTV